MQDQWSYVIAAYAVTALGALIVTGISWHRMARAETRALGLTREHGGPA